ncbi:hypothetical protein SLE2022_152690 [Rubroshorea leprosula]
MEEVSVLLLTLPFQSHINPSLQLAKNLARLRVRVTFMTTASAIHRIKVGSPPNDLSYAPLFHGYHGGFQPSDLNHNMSEIKRCGSQTLREFITAGINQGTCFTHIVYSMLMPWVPAVAREFHIPSTLFWNQPAIVFDIYFYYFHGYDEDIIKNNNISNPSFVVNLPGLPSLGTHDMPSFFSPSNPFTYVLPTFKEHMQILDEETNPTILVNTFDALEPEALNSVGRYNVVGVGPLMPSAYLDGNDPLDSSYGGDLYEDIKDYLEWLNSKPEMSVIYVSFGSIAVLSKQQKEEIASGLLESGRPFLWAIRESGEEREELSRKEELEKEGMIVSWCSQVEVLAHPSIGCFLTHCGWNSAIESLASGVPMVVFPQWADQPTNSKLVEDLCKLGVRMRENGEGIVEGCEIKRCLELVMGGGERGEEMRRNAKKWKELGREAAKEGGSSDNKLKTFVKEIGKKILT